MSNVAWSDSVATSAAQRWLALLAALDRRPTLAAYTQTARELAELAMELRSVRVALLASYTLDTIHPVLSVESARLGFATDIYQAPFNSVRQELLDPRSGCHAHEAEVVFVAQLLEDICPALVHDFLELTPNDVTALLDTTASGLLQAVRAFRQASRAAVVIHNFPLPAAPLLGLFEGSYAASQTAAVRQLNALLAQQAAEIPGVYVLDFDRIAANVGYQRWRHEQMWFSGHAPLAPETLPVVAREQAGFLQALLSAPRKCLVVDFDNTLWGGVIGEEGLSGITLGQTHPGNMFREVQRSLLQLHRRGVLLAANSKNNEADVLDVLAGHPDMLLRREHFAAWRVNWQPKPQNMLEIAAELNIGVDSLVFLDDSQRECAQVRQALPEVLSVEACSSTGEPDPLVTLAWLRDTRVFDKLSFTPDDRRRGDMYREQQLRRELESQATSVDDFLLSLGMQVEICPVDDFALPRVVDLLQKTNQFNLTTLRHSEATLQEWRDDSHYGLFTLRVSDRFGDNGLVGVAIVKIFETTAELDSFLLSCRVIGRRVETAFLAWLVQWCRQQGAEFLLGRFRPTAKNAPAANFLPDHGFLQIEDDADTTQWLLPLDQVPFTWPECIATTDNSQTHSAHENADRLLATVAQVLGVDATILTDEASPATLPQWDSLNHLNLILALESEFETQFAPGDVLAMQSVGAIREVLERAPGDHHAEQVSFSDLQAAELPAFREFIARSYHPGYVLAVNQAYVQWQFASGTTSPAETLRLRVARQGSEIVGCLGYIPVEVTAGNRTFRGAWLANWMVAPEHRQSGLGPLLAREVTSDFEVTLAAGANEEARDILSRMGYTDLGQLIRYVAVLNGAGAAELTATGTLDWPHPPQQSDSASASFPVESVARADDAFSQLWDTGSASKPGLAGTARTAAYLNWRYLDHPEFPYQLRAVRGEHSWRGVAVYRVEQARDQAVRIARLVELYGDPEVLPSLLSTVLSEAQAAGAVAMDFFCGSRCHEELLSARGFLSDPDPRVAQIPVLYQPLDRRRAGIRYLADLRNVPPGVVIDQWYVTKSDGDQDRPNA